MLEELLRHQRERHLNVRSEYRLYNLRTFGYKESIFQMSRYPLQRSEVCVVRFGEIAQDIGHA